MALSWSQQPTVLFSIRQNNTWTIRCFVFETNDPATQCKILKIVGFLHTKVEGRRVEEFPQFHSYCILFSTFQPTITGTVSTVVVHYGKHNFGITSIGKHPFCIIHLLTNHFANVFECFHFQNWFPNELSFSILVLFGNVLSFSKCARFCERFFFFLFPKNTIVHKILYIRYK